MSYSHSELNGKTGDRDFADMDNLAREGSGSNAIDLAEQKHLVMVRELNQLLNARSLSGGLSLDIDGEFPDQMTSFTEWRWDNGNELFKALKAQRKKMFGLRGLRQNWGKDSVTSGSYSTITPEDLQQQALHTLVDEETGEAQLMVITWNYSPSRISLSQFGEALTIPIWQDGREPVCILCENGRYVDRNKNCEGFEVEATVFGPGAEHRSPVRKPAYIHQNGVENSDGGKEIAEWVISAMRWLDDDPALANHEAIRDAMHAVSATRTAISALRRIEALANRPDNGDNFPKIGMIGLPSKTRKPRLSSKVSRREASLAAIYPDIS